MLDQEKIYNLFVENGVSFFTGVPDSYLNGFCNYILKNAPANKNVIAANEGNAIGIAAGHYMATKEVPLVYMQNSGLGNTINPLASLCDENVYKIPVILLIGWRGQPDTGDWAQHKLQGEITPKLLEVMNIPYAVLDDDYERSSEKIVKAIKESRATRKPYGLIAPKGVMAGEKLNNKDDVYPLSREEAIEIVLNEMPENTIYSATTGRATRELFFLRERRNETKNHDFLNVGSMGHASSVALGIALEKPDRKVVVFDGDSAAIMHLGALTMMSKLNVPNYIHVILNNGAHESVGGQPSAGHLVDFTKIADASGYNTVGKPVTNKAELIDAINKLKNSGKASLIDVRIHKGLNGKLPEIVFSHKDAIDALIKELNSKD